MKVSSRYSRKVMVAASLCLSIWLVLAQPILLVMADPLPLPELTALNNYTNWVGNCGSAIGDTATTPDATSGSAITPGPVYIMGDSITEIAKSTYQKKFASPWSPTVEGLSSRQISTTPPSPSGLGQLDKDKTTIGKAHAIVIALGTNGVTNSKASTTAQVKSAMTKVKGYNTQSAPIFWVNIIDSKYDAASKTTNEAIQAGVGSDGTVVDWYSEAKSKADYKNFNEGVHPTNQKDIDLLVGLVYGAVNGASSTPKSAATSGGAVSGGPLKPGVAFDDSQSGDTGNKTTVDDDGVDPSPTGSGSHQSSTSYASGKLGALHTNFFALNPGWASAHGLVLGDVAALTYHGKTIYAVYGDNHVGNTVHAEISVKAVLALSGVTDPKKADNLTGVHTVVYPGSHTQLAGSVDQAKIDQIGAQVSGGGSAATTTTTDQSSQASGCCPTSGGAPTAAPTGPDPSPGSEAVKKAVYDFFVGKGLKPHQAAGIMGNIEGESSFDQLQVESGGHSKNPADAGGGGWGIVQFTPGTKAVEIAKTAHITTPIYELNSQLEAVWAQLDGKAGSSNEIEAGKDIKAAPNVDEATKAWQGTKQIGGPYFGYERPKDESASLGRRTAAARGYLTKYGGSAAAAAPSGTGATSTTDPCCPPTDSSQTPAASAGATVADGSPADWIKMYTGANKAKSDKMAHGPLPNPKILAIHYTEGDVSGQSLLDFFSTQDTGIQFNVDKAGKVYQYYPLNDMKETYHVKAANNKAIGIEITGRDVTDLLNNDKQFQSVLSLSKFLCDHYKIPCSEPKGDISGDGITTAQGMLGHDEIPSNDHNDPDATYGSNISRTDSSKHPYMIKLRTAMGFNPTPGKSGGAAKPAPSAGAGSSSASSASSQCSGTASPASGNGTKDNPVGEGPNKSLALEAVKYDTKASNGKYKYVMGGLHGPLSELVAFDQKGGVADCSGFVRFIIWKVYGNDIGGITTQEFPSNSNFKEVSAADVAPGDIGWRVEHVDFITQNKGGGMLHQFGAHSSQTNLYGGDAKASDYTKFYRYVGPQGGATHP